MTSAASFQCFSSVSFAGDDWLVREVLAEAGDAAVLEPDSAREAVLAAAERLRAPARG